MIQSVTKRNEFGPATESPRSRAFKPGLALFILVLVIAGPVVHHWGEQQGSRYALTAALWDQRTVSIDDYDFLLVRDRAVVDGVTYSDKAPGQPFLAVPFYGFYRLAGGESPIDSYDPDADFGQWWVTFWTAAVPGAILAVLMFRWAREIEEKMALRATVTTFLGSMLLVYSTLLFGHVLASLFAFGMFLVVRKSNASWWRLLGAGALGGAAVLVEYPIAVIVGIVTITAFFSHRLKALAVIAGGTPAAILLGLYHTVLFGDPFTFTYQWSAFSGVQGEAKAALDSFAGPSLERFIHVLVSPRGLLIATPIILIAVIGLIPLWRSGRRVDAAVVAAVTVGMLAIPSSWSNSYAGGAGPRYFVPALPFLVAPLALAWRRWRLLTLGAAVVSVLTMVLATLTEPQMATQFEAGLRYWLQLAAQGDFEPTVYSMGLGSWGWVLYLASIAAAFYSLSRVAGLKMEGGAEEPGR